MYEAKTIGGRLATVKVDGDEVEAGGSIIHSKNMYMQRFVKLLGKYEQRIWTFCFLSSIIPVAYVRNVTDPALTDH